MKEKFLFVHGNSNNIAGQEIALLNMIRGLRDYGIDALVLLPSKGIFDSLLKDNGIQTYHFKLNHFSWRNFFGYFFTFFKIFRLVRKEKIAIIHCSGAYPVQYCLPAARLAKVPCIAHIHASVYSKEELRKVFLPFVDCIITVAEAIKSQLIRFGYPSTRIEIVYCGVLDEKDKNRIVSCGSLRASYQIKEDCKIIGQVSQIIPRKGLEYFIEMAKQIKSRNFKVKFMIIGNALPGGEEYERYIKNEVIEKGLSQDIIFTGFQSDVKRFISILDIFVLSSLSEALPLVLVESLALGKPVVATDVGGVKEVIINDETGFLVPPRDVKALVASVLRLLNESSMAEYLGKNGKELVYHNFTIRKQAEALLLIYKNILN